MNIDDMGLDVAQLAGPVGAVGAGVGLLPAVHHVVVLEVTFLPELFVANRAPVPHVGEFDSHCLSIRKLVERN